MLKKQTTMRTLKEEIKFIGSIVSRVTGANPFSNDRKRDNVDARFILFKLSRDFLNASYQKIGKILNRDHATVLYGCRQVDQLVKIDKNFRRDYTTCLKILTDTDLAKEAMGEVDIIDLVETKTQLNDMTVKYNELTKNIELTAWAMIGEHFAKIENSVIRGVMNDRNCSFQLSRTLKQVFVNKIK